MQQFTKRIIDNLKMKKTDYGDVRVVEREMELIVLKNGIIEVITRTINTGFGVRVLKDSAWGFSSSNLIKKSEADKVTRNALSIARASARVRSNNIILSSLVPQKGSYSTRVNINPLSVSLDDKIELLLVMFFFRRWH